MVVVCGRLGVLGVGGLRVRRRSVARVDIGIVSIRRLRGAILRLIICIFATVRRGGLVVLRVEARVGAQERLARLEPWRSQAGLVIDSDRESRGGVEVDDRFEERRDVDVTMKVSQPRRNDAGDTNEGTGTCWSRDDRSAIRAELVGQSRQVGKSAVECEANARRRRDWRTLCNNGGG